MSVQMPIDWDLIEDTIYDWLHEDLGFTDVIWGNSKAAQPPYPYLSLTHGAGPIMDGNGFDDKIQVYDSDLDTLTIQYTGPRLFTLSISAQMGEGEAFDVANNRGTALLGAIQSSILMDKTQNRLGLADLAIVSAENIIDTSVPVSGVWIFRGTLDLIFRTTSCLSEEVEIIEKVQIVSDDLDVDETLSI